MFIYNKFFSCFQRLCFIQRNPSLLVSKQLGRKDFSMEELGIDSLMLLCKQKNSKSINKSFFFKGALPVLGQFLTTESSLKVTSTIKLFFVIKQHLMYN